MNKRANPPQENGDDAYNKRQKLSYQSHQSYQSSQPPQPAVNIDSTQQLKQLLTFSQDVNRAKHGLQSFKVFLESFSEIEPEGSKKLKILRDYLDSQIPTGDDKSKPFLSDIVEIWKYAVQVNSDALLSAVPAILAQLLRTISRILDLAEHSLRVGRTVLQSAQQELLAKGLSAPESKEYVISPALRLLREVVLLDGGSLAKQVFRGRELTLKSLPRNLKIRYKGEGMEDVSRPSVRTNALRLVLSLIKFLNRESKQELVTQRDLVIGIVRDIRSDPDYLIIEILDGLKNNIIKDEGLSREARTKFINALNLSKLAGLYNHDTSANDAAGTKSVPDVLHDFLTLLCTSAEYGILFRQSGFYPKGIDPDDASSAAKGTGSIDLGMDSIDWSDKYTEEVPVKNTTLSEFLQGLRPWTNKKHSELILATFQAAPELVADYFFKKKNFSYDPKLTVTWIGYSAFLFSAIQLPSPAFFGHRRQYARLPPPTSIVIESILPQPLTQKSLTKCLNQKSPLISLFAIRVLTMAFTKLQEAIQLYREAAAEVSSIWTQAEEKLLKEFCSRCPAMKDVIQAFRSIASTDIMQREAALRLMAKYYEVVPEIALDAKFSVSDTLAKALRSLESDDMSASAEEKGLRLVEAEHLFRIAHRSPDIRWFNKLESLDTSPFMALLNLAATASDNVSSSNLESLLQLVIDENGLLQSATKTPALTALLTALKNSGVNASSARTKFLEFCFHKCATSPLKYADTLESFGKENSDESGFKPVISLFLLAITEEWSFLVKSGEEKDLKAVAQFIAQYLAASLKIKEDKKIIKKIIRKLSEDCLENKSCKKTIEGSRDLVESLELVQRKISTATTKLKSAQKTEPANQFDVDTLKPQSIELDSGAIHRWNTKDVEEVVEDGHMAALIMLLSSEHLSIRKETLTNLAKLAMKLKESTYTEKDQLWLLASEVVETAKPHVNKGPLPTVICSFAAAAVSVLRNPLHFMYAKVNRYLTQAPAWEIDRFPLMKGILNEPPSVDEAYYRELEWFLDYLITGLQTSDDMAIFHKRRMFERLLTMYSNAYLGNNIRRKILKLLIQSTAVEGGSTTLITRFGILSWLKAQAAQTQDAAVDFVAKRIMETCDQEKVLEWSKGTIKPAA